MRPLLSSTLPVYTGLTYVETFLYDSDTRHHATAVAVGGGSLFALSPGKGIVAHREPKGVVHAYVALRKPVEWFDSIDFSDGPWLSLVLPKSSLMGSGVPGAHHRQ